MSADERCKEDGMVFYPLTARSAGKSGIPKGIALGQGSRGADSERVPSGHCRVAASEREVGLEASRASSPTTKSQRFEGDKGFCGIIDARKKGRKRRKPCMRGNRHVPQKGPETGEHR